MTSTHISFMAEFCDCHVVGVIDANFETLFQFEKHK